MCVLLPGPEPGDSHMPSKSSVLCHCAKFQHSETCTHSPIAQVVLELIILLLQLLSNWDYRPVPGFFSSLFFFTDSCNPGWHQTYYIAKDNPELLCAAFAMLPCPVLLSIGDGLCDA